MNDEKWAIIHNHPNYEISDRGRVKNKKTGRILRQQTNQKGYLVLQIDGKNERVNRLVADAFYDGDNGKLDVDHVDGNKQNNNISNLEFCTRSENIQRAFKNGLSKTNLTSESRMKGTEAMKEKYSRPVRVVETGEIFSSIKECARCTGCLPTQISKCCKGLSKQHHGLHFEFV